MSECGRLGEVTVIILWVLQLQAWLRVRGRARGRGGEGGGGGGGVRGEGRVGLCMIQAESCIMGEFPLCDEEETTFIISIGKARHTQSVKD